MWTDEQLHDQGWTVEQIATYRTEEASEVISVVPESVISETVAPGNAPALLEDTFVASKKAIGPMMSNSTMTAILMAALLAIVPFSLYSISNAEGTQGPSGDAGISGMNGSDGSSFHLVTSADLLPTCDDSINNQIFFIAVDAAFQVCQNSIWTPIDLTGQSGLNGINGADGTSGTNGTNGTDGADGTNGVDGANGQAGADGADGSSGSNGLASLIATRTEPIIEGCQNGGTIVETGVDDNGDNMLSPNEVDSVVVVCNGDSGQDGADGAAGADGADGADGSSTLTMMVARLSLAPSHLGCNGTGQLLQQGMDNGAGNGIALNGALESGEIISSMLICTTFEVQLVEDINPSGHSDPSNFVSINSTMYFTANNGTASGIWAYENGTISLVYAGSVLSMRAIGSQLMFAGQGQGFNVKPYVFEPSNGTAWQITEIFPGGSSYPSEFTLIGTTVFFGARDSSGSTGTGLFDLWAYETLNYSVWKVEADIQPSSLIAVNSDLYFSAGVNNGNVELWKHETTTNTTFMIKDINPGILASSPTNLVSMGTTIYMSANDGGGAGTELHAYEINNNSTWVAADIRPGVAASMPSDLVVIGTQVYMKASSGTYFELWVYDSQNNSFWEISDIQSISGPGGPSGLTVNQYTVYFSADDGTSGEELWAHHSVNGTTWQVIDLKPTGGNIGDIHVHEGNLYFSGEDNWDGRELWRLTFSQEVSFI
jgi:ELWxxDGT repeat protein